MNKWILSLALCLLIVQTVFGASMTQAGSTGHFGGLDPNCDEFSEAYITTKCIGNILHICAGVTSGDDGQEITQYYWEPRGCDKEKCGGCEQDSDCPKGRCNTRICECENVVEQVNNASNAVKKAAEEAGIDTGDDKPKIEDGIKINMSDDELEDLLGLKARGLIARMKGGLDPEKSKQEIKNLDKYRMALDDLRYLGILMAYLDAGSFRAGFESGEDVSELTNAYKGIADYELGLEEYLAFEEKYPQTSEFLPSWVSQENLVLWNHATSWFHHSNCMAAESSFDGQEFTFFAEYEGMPFGSILWVWPCAQGSSRKTAV